MVSMVFLLILTLFYTNYKYNVCTGVEDTILESLCHVCPFVPHYCIHTTNPIVIEKSMDSLQPWLKYDNLQNQCCPLQQFKVKFTLEGQSWGYDSYLVIVLVKKCTESIIVGFRFVRTKILYFLLQRLKSGGNQVLLTHF